ncbi:protein FAM76A-like isoform X1 [Asterias rubens]|uniref:protein FAM76A-like isoform X1 n=1 Tax=Asterias rubens TaxID=7604 RepID=UPI0014550194|nr:protein FAM76A-like isoform X1 [Asterias rubens]
MNLSKYSSLKQKALLKKVCAMSITTTSTTAATTHPPLFACTKCNSRHPFEELSQGQQLCKECRGSYPVVKCTYCRAEFQQENKSSTNTICKKCAQNVKLYGTPKPCEYCNVIAAFIGNKCQRCANSEKKYGPPHTCEQCKQKCGFDRKEERKKVDGKLLCWLCTLSYKRVLQKAKKRKYELASSHHRTTQQSKDNNEVDSSKSDEKVDKVANSRSAPEPNKKLEPESNKRVKTDYSSNGILPSSLSKSDVAFVDPGNTDHMVAMTQLRETIASLKKLLTEKEKVILERDKKITELRATHMQIEKDLRNKLGVLQRQHGETMEDVQAKNRALAKQVSMMCKTKPEKTEVKTQPLVL